MGAVASRTRRVGWQTVRTKAYRVACPAVAGDARAPNGAARPPNHLWPAKLRGPEMVREALRGAVAVGADRWIRAERRDLRVRVFDTLDERRDPHG